jgi:hypothetical protein
MKNSFDNFCNFLRIFFGLDAKNSEQENEFTEELEIEKGFADFYQKNLRAMAFDAEDFRISKLNKVMFWARTAFLTTFLSWGAFYNYYDYLQSLKSSMAFEEVSIFDCLVASILMSNIIVIAITFSRISEYKDDIKRVLFAKIFDFFEGFSYHPKPLRNEENYDDFDILPESTESKGEDMVLGNYKGVNLLFEELELSSEWRDAKGNRRKKVVFVGFVLMLGLNKKISGKTILEQKKGFLRNKFRGFASLEKVELEDPIFGKKFKIYSSDQIEARYLLTTSFMERCLELSESLNGKNISASFYRQSLLLTVETNHNNLFEPASIFRRMDVILESKKIIRHLKIIFDIIDTLKIDQKSGL